jgi:RNA polymerase sigma factor (sigma-70 family)
MSAVQVADAAQLRSSCSEGKVQAMDYFQLHQDQLFRFARRLCNQRDDAVDLVQETFVRFLRSEVSFDSPEHARAWLYRTLANLARDNRRRSVVRERTLEDGAGPVSIGSEGREVAKLAVHAALGHLGVRRRAVVVLYEIEGESVRDIGRLLGVSPVTVRWHLMMARRQLSEILS